MQPIGLADVIQAIGEALSQPSKENLAQVDSLLWDALNQFDQMPHLWHYAAQFSNHLGRHALAAQCLRRCYELESNPNVLANIGVTLRMQQKPEEARFVTQLALKRNPDDLLALGTLAANYVNEGNPQPGIEAGEEALRLGTERPGELKFNLGLLHLEAGNFARGFDLYAEGEHRWRENRMYATDGKSEPPVLTPQLHEFPCFRAGNKDGTKKTLLVYGEQGIGDEIMFSTMLCDVARDYNLVFDCHPRLESLHRNSSWALRSKAKIFPWRKERGDASTRRIDVDVDAKIAIGNLCRIYRRDLESFQRAWTDNRPLLYHPAHESEEYRKLLTNAAEGRKIIGIAFRGGTISTATKHRRLPEEAIKSFLERKDCLFVSLDYEDMTGVARWAHDTFGPRRFIWPASINFAWDYHHVAALLLATDLVISVPQSVAHLSAACGQNTVVLNPFKTAWREANCDSCKARHEWYWYGKHAKMLRQTESGIWPIEEAHNQIDALGVK